MEMRLHKRVQWVPGVFQRRAWIRSAQSNSRFRPLCHFTAQLQTYGFLGVDRGHLKDKVEDKRFDTPMAACRPHNRKLVELLDANAVG